jgi:hypothetical protein
MIVEDLANSDPVTALGRPLAPWRRSIYDGSRQHSRKEAAGLASALNDANVPLAMQN